MQGRVRYAYASCFLFASSGKSFSFHSHINFQPMQRSVVPQCGAGRFFDQQSLARQSSSSTVRVATPGVFVVWRAVIRASRETYSPSLQLKIVPVYSSRSLGLLFAVLALRGTNTPRSSCLLPCRAVLHRRWPVLLPCSPSHVRRASSISHRNSM